ncbi:MAG: DEAD/DEAH box helicase family protein, partial [Candidatus Lokiarchaeota archaeon]|nr:DEAD/DEAH box helicase family protein [Candidatus Lokiarchaeota archaeon]
MARIISESEVAKRTAILAMKTSHPSMTWRDMAQHFKTSTRVIQDALKRDLHALKVTRNDPASKQFPITIHPLDPVEAMSPRGYQVTASRQSIERNTLLVLPTGLGKTIVALLHVQAILSSVAAGICLMMAPTKALLVQHRDLFQHNLAIPDAGLAIVDGETMPDNRRVYYQSLTGKRIVLFMTPQTVLHDLEKGRLPRAAIIDLVVDEAHHATRGDPYALVYAYLREHHIQPRVLAMTASPGETEQHIIDVCQNLGINPADMIIKTREDPDVEAYVFHLDVKRYELDLTPEYEDVRGRLVAVLREPCAWLQSAGLAGKKVAVGADSLSLPSWEELQVLADKHLAGASARGIGEGEIEPDADTQSADQPALAVPGARRELVSNLVLALRARHCVELVETQGFPALLAYHEKLAAKVAEEPTESLLALVTHPQYKAAIDDAGKLVSEGSPRARHPKLDALGDVMRDFTAAHPASRCIVFTKYRASIPMLVEYLSGVAGVAARRFVGQGSPSPKDVGMNRDEQQAVLRAFKAGEFNVLVATKAAEEGIDVAECDMVAFYEATASVIQFIQRQGRAGRRRDGNIAIMHARGTSDQLNAAMLDGKLAAMPGILYRVQHVRAASMPAPRPAAVTRMPKPPSSKQKAPSSTITKKEAPPPILVHPDCIGASVIVAGLAAAGIEARADRSIPESSMVLAGGVQVRVINTNDAEDWTAELTIEELPGAARRVVAVCPDGQGD